MNKDNSDSYYQFSLQKSEDPHQHLRDIYDKWATESPNESKTTALKRFIKFIEVDLPQKHIITLDFPNTGNTEEAAGTILLVLGTAKRLPQKLVPELYDSLYPNKETPIEDVYFEYTQIRGLFEWWEVGEVRQESFGEINDDHLVGFVRVGL